MKRALARAILMKADILLLDEPTNPLDFTNVAWLENYLTTLTGVSAIIVSHDPGVLDHVCTDIIHYEKRKLKQLPRNQTTRKTMSRKTRQKSRLMRALLRENPCPSQACLLASRTPTKNTH